MSRLVKSVVLASTLTALGSLPVVATPLTSLVLALQDDPLTTARERIKAGKFQEAITLLDKVIKDNPTVATPYFDRGRAYFSLNNFAKAEEDFTQVTKLREKYPNGWFNRGITRMRKQDWANAIPDFTQVITLNPKQREGDPVNLVAESLSNRAVCYLTAKQFDKALLDCNELIRIQPDRVDAFINRAYAYTSMTPPQDDMALADYAVIIGKSDSAEVKRDAYFGRADIQLRKNKFAEAIADYTEGLKLQPDNVDAYVARASANFQLNKFTEALNDYDNVIRLRPADPEGFKNRAAVKVKMRDFKGAITDYSAYLQKVPSPNDPNIFRFRAAAYLNVEPKNYAGAIGDLQSYLGKKASDDAAWKDLAAAQYNSIAPGPGKPFDKAKAAQLDQAIASATKATTLNPKQADAFLILADSLSLQEKFTQSIAPYSSYIALKPAEPYGYDGRGRARYNTQEWTGAVADFDQYLKLKPNDMEARKLRALAFTHTGAKPEEQITELTKAIEADPSDPVAYTNRGVAYYNLDNFDKAIADFQKAVDLKPDDMAYLGNLASAWGKKADRTKAPADYQSAAAAYGKLLAKAPADANSLAARADIYIQLKQWDSAIADYGKFLATNPTDLKTVVAVYLNRAFAALQKSPADYKSAIADYGQVIAKQPADPKAYDLRGRAYLDQKDYVNAVADLDKLIQLSGGNDVDAYLSRASAYFNIGMSKRQQPGGGAAEFDKAAADYGAYVAKKPDQAEPLFSRGLSLYRKGQGLTGQARLAEFKKAITDFEAAIKLKADYADAFYYLGLAADNYGVADELSQEEMFKKAIAAYEKYVSLPGVPAGDVQNIKNRVQQLKDAL